MKRKKGNVAAKALVLIAAATRDRDEWKQQHENLLAMYRASQADNARLRDLLNRASIPANG